MNQRVYQAMVGSGYLDGQGRAIPQIVRTATFACKQVFARPIHELTEKQIVWAYEKWCDEIVQAEAEGYGCPNPN